MSGKRVTMTDEKIEAVLQGIASGRSLTSSCADVGVKATAMLYIVNSDPTISERYARARESCADSQFDEMNDLERKVLTGELDPNSFRAAMDSRKWRLARMHIKYNERQIIEQKTEHSGAVTIEHALAPELAAVCDSLLNDISSDN